MARTPKKTAKRTAKKSTAKPRRRTTASAPARTTGATDNENKQIFRAAFLKRT